MKKFAKTFFSALGFGAPTTTQETKNLLDDILLYMARGTVIAGGFTSIAYSGIMTYDTLSPVLPYWATMAISSATSVGCFFLIDVALGAIAPFVIKEIVTGGFRKNNAKAVATIAFSIIVTGQVITTTSWSLQGSELVAVKMVEKPQMFVSSETTRFNATTTPYDKDIANMEEQENSKKQAVNKYASELAQSKRAPIWAEIGWKVKKKNAEAVAQWSAACKEAGRDSAAYFTKNYKPNAELEEWKKAKLNFLSIKTEDDSKEADSDREKEKISLVDYEKKKEFIINLIGKLGQYSTYFFLLVSLARVSLQQGEATGYRGIRIWPFSGIIDYFSKKKRLKSPNSDENDFETSETGHFEPETMGTIKSATATVLATDKSGNTQQMQVTYSDAKRKCQSYEHKMKNFNGKPDTNVRNFALYYNAMLELDSEAAQEYLLEVMEELPAGIKNLLATKL
jgi:hypothetical protein